MSDTWIDVDANVRRRNRWLTLVWTVVLAGLGALGLLPRPSAVSAWWGGAAGVLWLVMLAYALNLTCARASLTAEGIRCHTIRGRRTIPWHRIVEIEKIRHRSRGGSWWEIRARMTNGRSRAIPGTFTNLRRDESIDRKLATIEYHWAASARQ